MELNAVTIGNMSIDSKLVETDGRRGRYQEITVDSGARESVVNPDDWPYVDLKPSQGSVKGQRFVGPGGEKINDLGDVTVKVRTKQHGGGDISSRVTFQGAKVRKPLLALSGVIDKGHIVVFDGSGPHIMPSSCASVASVRRAITGVQGRIPLLAKNEIFVLRTWEPDDMSSTGFQSAGNRLKGPSTRLSEPAPPVRPLKEKELGPFGELSISNPGAEVPGRAH